MLLDALLAYLHLAAILTMVVFLTSEAALCRAEWLNAAVVLRLARVDVVYGVAALAVLATGCARVFWGPKGAAWYGHNWLLHVKLAAFAVVALGSLRPTLAFRRWRRALQATGALPAPDEVAAVRRSVMRQAHLVALIPLAATLLARGFGGR